MLSRLTRAALISIATFAIAGGARAEALRFNGALSGPGDAARYRVSLHGGHQYRSE